MSAFIPLDWLDTWALSTALRFQQKALERINDGVFRLEVIGNDAVPEKLRPHVHNTLTRVRTKIRAAQKALPALMEYEITGAYLELLSAHAMLPFRDAAGDAIDLHVAIVTNPLAVLYAGPAQWTLGQGFAVAVAPPAGLVCGAINHGDTSRIHLIVNLRKQAQE